LLQGELFYLRRLLLVDPGNPISVGVAKECRDAWSVRTDKIVHVA
jgi:hypothetical protein